MFADGGRGMKRAKTQTGEDTNGARRHKLAEGGGGWQRGVWVAGGGAEGKEWVAENRSDFVKD